MYIVGSSWWYLNIFKAYMIIYDIGWNDIGLLMGNDGIWWDTPTKNFWSGWFQPAMTWYSHSMSQSLGHWRSPLKNVNAICRRFPGFRTSAVAPFFFNLTLQAFHHRLRGRVKSVKRRSQSTRLPVSLEDDCRFYMLLSCSISIFCHLHRHILLQQIAISTDPTLRAAPAASLCFAFQPPVAPELLPAVSSPHARTLQECHLNSSMAMATLW